MGQQRTCGGPSDHEGQDTEREDGVIAWNKDERTGYRVWLAILHQAVPGSRLHWPAVSVAELADQWLMLCVTCFNPSSQALSPGRDGSERSVCGH